MGILSAVHRYSALFFHPLRVKLMLCYPSNKVEWSLACTLGTPAFVGIPGPRHRFRFVGPPPQKPEGGVLASPHPPMPAHAPPYEPLLAPALSGGTRGEESGSPAWHLWRYRRCLFPSRRSTAFVRQSGGGYTTEPGIPTRRMGFHISNLGRVVFYPSS